MFCVYCRQELPEDAAFCNRCGKRVPHSASITRDLTEQATHPNPSGATYGLTEQTTHPNPPSVSGIMPQSIDSSFPAPTGPFVTSATTPQTSQLPPPLSPLQRLLVRVFQQELAGNALFGVVAGSIMAIVAGVAVSWLLLTLAHAASSAVPATTSASGEESTIDSILGIYLLHAPFRDSLQLFLSMHGVGLHMLYGTTTYTFTSPLSGLLLVPALFLTGGGYLAASTDLSNQARRSLVRGAAIALPYTLILLILSWQVNGTANQANSGPDTIMMDTTTLFIFGLLWGVLFGLLGASLKLARGQWRHLLHRTLHTSTHPQIAGMIAGACWASISGLVLSFIALCGLLTYTSFSIPVLTKDLCLTGDWQSLLAWGIAQGPLHAVNLFFFLLGAPITYHASQATSQQCFYTDLSQTSLTLRDQNLHLAAWTYALLFIPALSLFCGGRISAAISRVQGKGPSAINGALIAIPFTVIMLLLTFLSTVTLSSVSSSNAVPTVQSVGVSATDLLLWALLSGAIFGALGGLYQGGPAQQWDRQILVLPSAIVEFLAKPIYLFMAQSNKQLASSLRTSTRSLLYCTLSCTLLLTIVTAVAAILLVANNQIITLQVNQHVRDVISVLLITIPGLLLFCTFATALYTDPAEAGSHTSHTFSVGKK